MKWDQLDFASSMGPATVELLAIGLEGTILNPMAAMFGGIVGTGGCEGMLWKVSSTFSVLLLRLNRVTSYRGTRFQ